MDNQLNELLQDIELEYGDRIQRGARNYLEISLAERARKMGYGELSETYKTACAIVPLKDPQRGMKVRIDGRTFVNYAEHDSGIAVPGHLTETSARNYRTFVPNDSMICNF
ncbi:hypothetical protein [Desulfosarcina sp.]|uniref:hypothetical protein n=1 Tax=Desulfosarcina sp. TaxID=2027861 RepID=UPI003970DC5D